MIDVEYEWYLLRGAVLHRDIRWWLVDRTRVWTEKLLLALARQMPRSLRYWATIVSCSQATTGSWGSEHPDSVSIMTMLTRIEP